MFMISMFASNVPIIVFLIHAQIIVSHQTDVSPNKLDSTFYNVTEDEDENLIESKLKNQKTTNDSQSKVKDSITKAEYEKELKAISEILGIKFEANNQTLDNLKNHVRHLIDKVKQNKEENNVEENKIVDGLESSLKTLKHVTGIGAIHTLRSFRHQLEETGESLTDEILTLLDRMKPNLNVFGDKLNSFLKKFENQVNPVANNNKCKDENL